MLVTGGQFQLLELPARYPAQRCERVLRESRTGDGGQPFRRERLVQRPQVENAVQIRLAGAQEPQGIGMISRLLKGRGERVIGDIHVLVGQIDFCTRQSFAGDALDLTVDDSLGALRIAEDPLDRVDMRLEELVDDIGILIEERLADNDVGRHKLAVRPERALIDKDFAMAFDHQTRRPRFRHPGSINFSPLEQRQDGGIIRREESERFRPYQPAASHAVGDSSAARYPACLQAGARRSSCR